ncbi:MAG: right-handed parallel beta-helix repeat-containing protein [Candidatus Thermoplasmatota archaeon]|nr:right-handed parallel beta-helix repeat-containing protein [Candidatus Thermoplasmatota archaeon]
MKCIRRILNNNVLTMIVLLLLAMLLLPAALTGSVDAYGKVESRSVDDNIIVWKENSTHYINKKLEIGKDETLMIEPGVKVYFSYGGPSNGNPYSLRIKGKLLALGEPDNPILFTSNATNPAPNDWDKIKFHSSADDNSIMEHCIVEYSIQGVQVDRASVTIRNNVMRNIGKYGIKVTGASSPVIENNTINTRNIGIRMIEEKGQGTPNPVILNNIFDNNSFYAILVDSASETVIANNIIRNSGEYGIYSTVANPVIEGNRFEKNKIGIAFRNSKGMVRDNEILGSTEFGIYMAYGNELIVRDNVIENNVIGIHAENTGGTVENNEFRGVQTRSIEMTDCNLTLANNEYNGLISSFKHVVLQGVNSDGYPIKGTSMTISDGSGKPVTDRELGETSTILLGLENYNIDPSGTMTSYLPYKVIIEKDGVKTENVISDLSIPLHQVKLEKSFVPKVTVTSQEESGDTVTISGKVDFDELDTEEMECIVMVKVKGGDWRGAMGKSKWGYACDSSEVTEGDLFEVKLVDGISDPTIKENIDVEDGGTIDVEDGDTEYIFLVTLCIGIVVMFMVLLLVSRRRGKQKEEKKEQE